MISTSHGTVITSISFVRRVFMYGILKASMPMDQPFKKVGDVTLLH